ncbi:MAG: hypothetical protein A07HR60_02652 [uncultured archaeon A07HR60]|nr:MAG: hypothetical protein A07HR60_02652 [uncultured archaeon A07HR60]
MGLGGIALNPPPSVAVQNPSAVEQDRVDIWTDEYPTQLYVVTGIPDDSDITGIPHSCRPVEKLWRPGTAGEKCGHTQNTSPAN